MSRRPLLRETIGYRQLGRAQGLSSPGRRSFWALTTSLMAGNDPPVPPRPRVHPSVREIHKNAWLKRQINSENKKTHHPFSKKGEKFWVVFCVHDDVEAFLEFYSEPKMGTIHKPISSISLNSCLHVSPSIMGQDNEYEFAVTLQNEVIRLFAANWEQMIEWVESLQGKLREMNILSPKDNLYSKLPDSKMSTVASTRDPNSPLPPTPSALAANALMMVNQRHVNQNARTDQAFRNNDISSSNTIPEGNSRFDEPFISNMPSRLSVNGNTSVSNQIILERENSRNNDSHNVIPRPSASFLQSSSSASSGTSSSSSSSSSSHSNTVMENVPDNSIHQAKRKQQVSVKVNVDVSGGVSSSSRSVAPNHTRHHYPNGTVAASSTTVVLIGNGDARIHNGHNDSRSTGCSPSISINSCASTSPHGSSTEQGNSNGLGPWLEGNGSDDVILRNGEDLNAFSNFCVSRVSVNCMNAPKPRSRPSSTEATSGVRSPDNIPTSTILPLPNKTIRSTSSENIYEHIYIPERLTENGRDGTKQQPNSNHSKMRSHHSNEMDLRSNGAHHQGSLRSPEEEWDSGLVRDPHFRRLMKVNNSGSSPRSSSLGRVELPQTSSSISSSSRSGHEDSRRNGNRAPRQVSDLVRSVGNSSFFSGTGAASQTPDCMGNPVDVLLTTRSGEYRLRREECVVRIGNIDLTEADNQFNLPSSQFNDLQVNGSHLPLKEQQVMHLQMEINYPGGVRIVLRKKDCMSSIAFVDYLGAVWIAGWKQTQFPVLYYAFHVGDQILKVAGVNVQSSVEASRAIKMVSSMQVEFIIRRIPYGKVFALKRSRDGEPLGLVAEGGSGEISEVLQDGLAARYGLPPKGISLDGQTPCNWYLTEVNNRPLSLMSKENEVKDRLNALGKEISILVQPADLVKHLRKSLKSYKGFKDYIVG